MREGGCVDYFGRVYFVLFIQSYPNHCYIMLFFVVKKEDTTGTY